MNEQILTLRQLADDALDQISQADTIRDLEAIRLRYLGKKGAITIGLKSIASFVGEERKAFGRVVNELKDRIQSTLEGRKKFLEIETIKLQLESECIDVTQPARGHREGTMHLISRTLDRMEDIFSKLGFDVATGPEIEEDYYNFEALNMPADHPARAMHDTFYVDSHTVLRTHTSPVQIRYMHQHAPPIRVIAPGKVYRCDSDMTHTPMFHQVEGLAIDTDITFADLKGILIHFVHEYFEKGLDVRFRPSYFPFTEPSAEVDIACVFCEGKGCRVCSQTGWIEVLGSGMVHPAVLKHGGVDTRRYSGFAFGMGVERLSMLRYGVNDLRLYFENDLDFLRQF